MKERVNSEMCIVILGYIVLKTLPNDKFLEWTKFKAFCRRQINVAQMMIPVFDRIENIMGTGENADYQHFLLFPQCFQKPLFYEVVKSRDCDCMERFRTFCIVYRKGKIKS